MIDGSVARRYAKALLELAREADQLDRILGDITRFEELCASGDGRLGDVLTNPLFTHAERSAMLEQIVPRFGLHPTTQNFLRLLVDKDRMAALPGIVREYRALADLAANRVRATVTTASPLDPATFADVQHALDKATGKNVVIETAVDPSLLGGIVARVGSIVYDASLRTRLDRLQLSLSAPLRA